MSEIIGGTSKTPPRIETKEHLMNYLHSLVDRAESSMVQIPNYQAANMAGKDAFKNHHRSKDLFWIHYGSAASAVDLSCALGQIEAGTYQGLKDRLNAVLIQTMTGPI